MKTLFIQTHELAKKLDPDMYTCPQVLAFLLKKTGGRISKSGGAGFSLWHSASLLMLSLFKEQKEELNWSGISLTLSYNKGETHINAFYLSNIFDIDYYETMGYEQMMIKSVEIRQRLINSLLTRPDRTMCVLIPE